MKRAPAFALALSVGIASSVGVGLGAPNDARGALPPSYGGTISLVAPTPITTLDPAAAHRPFELALARAIADPLYVVSDDGYVPFLAEDAPEIEGQSVRIRIRTDVRRHGRRSIDAAFVARSLNAAGRSPHSRWLFGAFAQNEDGTHARATSREMVELTLQREGADPTVIEQILASHRLSIVGGPDRVRRPIGTGPFRPRRLPDGSTRLTEFRLAPRGAPYLARIDIGAPRDRAAALRAFELGELDASFFGASLYGGRATRPTTRSLAGRSHALLIANRVSGHLRDDGLWGAVGRAIDRRRLARAGISRATDRLRADLPPPRLPAGARPATPPTLRLLVLEADQHEARVAETISALLDEAGLRARVISAPASRYHALVEGRAWDLRLGTVVPAIGRRGGLLGAALAAAGQGAVAEELVREGGLRRPEVAARFAPRLSAVVLGVREDHVHTSPELVGLAVADGHTLAFDDVRFPRRAP